MVTRLQELMVGMEALVVEVVESTKMEIYAVLFTMAVEVDIPVVAEVLTQVGGGGGSFNAGSDTF